MTTNFDDWLRACEAAGWGGPDWVWPASRGQAGSWEVVLDADLTGATMRGIARLAPDTAGDPIVTFDVSGPTIATVDGETTSTFTFSLDSGTGAASTGAFPSPSDGSGVADFALMVFLTLSGGSEGFFAGGIVRVLGD